MIEKFKQMSKVNKAILILSIVLVVMVISFCIYMVYLTNSLNEKTNNLEEEQTERVYDPNLIPTYGEVNQVMGALVKDVYGREYADLLENTKGDYLKLPDSNVKIDRYTFGDARDLAAITALIYYKNPYLTRPEEMEQDSPLLPSNAESVKEMPNGGTIDLSTIVEEYTDISLYYSRNNPLYISIEGKSNGNSFTEDIDLSVFYQFYFYE